MDTGTQIAGPAVAREPYPLMGLSVYVLRANEAVLRAVCLNLIRGLVKCTDRVITVLTIAALVQELMLA